jgi:hypothetical protein
MWYVCYSLITCSEFFFTKGYLFPSSEIRWFPTLYYAWEWRCFLGYRTQKTLHEPPQKGLSSQQHSFLYRWIGTYRMKETKIESKFHFPLDPAEIFCNSTCFYKFEGQLCCCDRMRSDSFNFELQSHRNRPVHGPPYIRYCKGGLGYIRHERVSACFFLFQGNFSQKENRLKSSRKECYIKLWILFSSGCLDLENPTHFIQRNGGHTVVMVAPPPLPTNRNYTTFPGPRERVTSSFSAGFF